MRIRWIVLCKALGLALILVIGAESARVGLGSNFHTVIPDRCYRCAQPSPDDLRVLAHRLGIRSVVNLRGFDDRPWYEEERALAGELGLTFADAGMWASYQPRVEELLTVMHAVDESPEPILIHCQSGSDRSGVASAIYLLLKTDASVEEAWGQLSVRHGHNPWGKAACQDRLLEAYVVWLAEHGWPHSRERLWRWAREDYRPQWP